MSDSHGLNVTALRWWRASNGLVLSDRDPTGKSGGALSSRTKISMIVSVVIGLALLALAIWILSGNEVTVRRRRGDFSLSAWLPLIGAAILLPAPWYLKRAAHSGGANNRSLMLMPKRVAVIMGGVIYRIPWEAIVAANPDRQPGILRLDLRKPANSFAVVKREMAPTQPFLFAYAGDGVRESVVLNHYIRNGAARATLSTQEAADMANRAR